jgi:hypothetical protein
MPVMQQQGFRKGWAEKFGKCSERYTIPMFELLKCLGDQYMILTLTDVMN